MSAPEQVTEPVRADPAAVRAALAVYEDVPGQVSVCVLGEVGGRMDHHRYDTTAAELDRAARDVVKIDAADEPAGIYVRGTTVAESAELRGKADDSVAWVAIRADLDLGKPGGPTNWAEVFSAYAGSRLPEPTEWQRSGTGLYPVFRLAEPVADAGEGCEARTAAKRVESELKRAWSAAGFTTGVDACADAARVWRLAGTVHRKDPSNPIASTVGRPTGRVFTLAELVADLPTEPALTTTARRAGAGSRTFTAGQARDFMRRHAVDPVRQSLYPGNVNTTLNDAGVVVGHFVAEFFTGTDDEREAEAFALLEAPLLEGPGRAPRWRGLNDQDRATIRSGLRRGMAEPYALAETPPMPLLVGGPTEDGYVIDGLTESWEGCGRTARVRTGPDPAAREDGGHGDPAPGGLVIQRLSDLAAEVDAEGEPTWLIRGLWPAGDYGVHAAESKAQKTWNAADLAVSVAAGRPWLGAFPIDTTGPVLMFVGEGGRRNIVRRLRAIGRSRGVADPDALPIDICARAPHLSNDVHMAVIDDHVRTVRPALVVLDPLYLAAKGGNLADLYAMGDLLERAQRVCQDNGAALLVVHHFNRKHGAGRDRMSGAGPAEWGRVLITGVVKGRRTDDSTKRTDVTTVLTVVGGEVPDQAVEIQRAVWAEDPDALGSPMHYQVAATVLGEVALGDDMTPIERERHWNDPGQGRLPDDIVAYSGVGQGAIADVARFLRARADGGVGVTMAEMRKALRSALVHPESRKPRHSDDTMDRAWGALSEMKRIVPVDGATGAGRSLWQRRPGDPEWI